MNCLGTVAFLCSASLAGVVLADQVALNPSKDTTLYESSTGAFSNALGAHFFAGRTNQGELRRGLIAFDLTVIPAGSTINSVRLDLYNDRGSGSNAFTLHRMLQDWGEGTSNAGNASDGQGVAPTPGDATWLHASFPNVLWTTPGGDFAPTVSARTVVNAQDLFAWQAPGMIADVQAWVDDPASNFGWMLRGNETTNRSARRFVSGDTTNFFQWPVLTVNYTVPAPGILSLASLLMLHAARRRR